jgi:hypothetical protein
MLDNNNGLEKTEEEILEEKNRRFISARNIALAGVLGTAIAILSAKCTQIKQEPEALPQNDKYVGMDAPDGYIKGPDGKCYKDVTTYPIKIVTEEGVRYEAPAGYTLGPDGKCYKTMVITDDSYVNDIVEIIGEDGTIIHAPKVEEEGRFFQEYYAFGYTQDKKQYKVLIIEPTMVITPDGVKYEAPAGYMMGYDKYGKAYCYQYKYLLEENISLSPNSEAVSRKRMR